MSDDPNEKLINANTKYSLSSRKSRKPIIAVGGSSVRLIDASAYKRYVDRNTNIASWKRLQFNSGEVNCVVCNWRPPRFLTDRHKRTFLTIHHLVSVADGGTDKDDNLIILCPNCHSLADYLPSIIVLPHGNERRQSLIDHLRLLNSDPEKWKCQFDAWRIRQKRNAVNSLHDSNSEYDGSLEPFQLIG